ncbi:MAG: glycosyltransferase family 39 protein, partial [Flavobacteriaceae bacterium]
MSQITSLLRTYPWLICRLIAFFVFIQFNWSYPINILDEAKNSEAAREMLETGRWFYPTFNDVIRTDKPPLHYFFMALGYLVFGVGPFGARFFSAVFGALTFYLIVKQTAKELGNKTAIYSGLTFVSSLLFAHEFHMAVPDPYLIFAVTWAIVSFYRFEKESSKAQLWMAYIAIGLGLLAKGPIAAVIVLLSAALYFTLTQQWSKLFTYQPFGGVLLSLAIAAPWYYMAHIATEGVFTEGFFLDHNLNRFSDQKEGHGGPFIITPLLVIAGLLPFGVWLISALIKSFHLRKRSNWLTLCFSVAIAVLTFFSFSSTKLPNYPMPAFGFMTVVLGFYFSELVSNQNSKALKGGLWVLT